MRSPDGDITGLYVIDERRTMAKVEREMYGEIGMKTVTVTRYDTGGVDITEGHRHHEDVVSLLPGEIVDLANLLVDTMEDVEFMEFTAKMLARQAEIMRSIG